MMKIIKHDKEKKYVDGICVTDFNAGGGGTFNHRTRGRRAEAGKSLSSRPA